MGAYSYKQVMHRIPKKYTGEEFTKRYGEEHDGDVGYGGDGWISASDWIDDLQEGLISAANFMRGMSLDPGISEDRRAALKEKADKTEEAAKEFEKD